MSAALIACLGLSLKQAGEQLPVGRSGVPASIGLRHCAEQQVCQGQAFLTSHVARSPSCYVGYAPTNLLHAVCDRHRGQVLRRAVMLRDIA